MLRFPLIIVLVLLCTTVSFAQSKKKKRSKKPQRTEQQSNSLSPYFPSENYEPEKKGSKSKKKKSRKPTAVDDFYDRREEVARARVKAEKELAKPQYSDPSYFGHKRKPKKRPPHKMKFCKVCEIRH